MDLQGACALVTGASGGLGRVICRQLATAGTDVAVAYLSGADRAAAVCDEVAALGGRAQAVKIDQQDPASVAGGVSEVVEHLGGIDLLINNAAMASGGYALPQGDLEAFTPEIWDEMMAVNVRGPYLMTRAASSHLRRSKWGRVVNIGSTIGHGPWQGAAAFAPSKGAVVALTRFLAAALAPDVTVNCVSPGLMEGTRMSSGAPATYLQSWRDRALLGTGAALDDVARQVLVYCRSRTVTGQSLVIDDGIHFD